MQIEAITLDEWYPLALEGDLVPEQDYRTQLLGTEIIYRLDKQGNPAVRVAADGRTCPVARRYRTYWTSLGRPDGKFFDIPEFAEPDRRVIGLGSMRIHVAGLRAVENFLDMAHFPFVHGGLLGEVPHTQVRPYQVKHDAQSGDLYALDCAFYQPMAAASASGGIDAQYVYRVMRPLAAMLYKTCAADPQRRDVICLFTQPLDDEWCVAHLVLACIDDQHSDSELRLFQQTIVGQDVTILNNHWPRKLPLDPRFEVPGRADAMSSAYRRWLADKGVVYGTYRAVAPASEVAA
jgi:phenylpropionate dioxygenase-like ring-hydroxylating dioxygenase large terminal subunit